MPYDNQSESPLNLGPLSPADFRIYNRLAEQMENIHNGFRATWAELKTACSSPPSRPQFPTPPPLAKRNLDTDSEIILLGLSFCSGLSSHHSIEERYIFPLLAERMPEFAAGGVLTEQHEVIHDGLIRLGAFLRGCERYLHGDEDGWGLDRGVLKGLLEGEDGKFESVLWEHLDQEVELLRPSSLRRVWGVEDLRRFAM
ncbi:hypothetical protein BDW72DRAFT_213827 [Aspergillus terricola var. indicus]